MSWAGWGKVAVCCVLISGFGLGGLWAVMKYGLYLQERVKKSKNPQQAFFLGKVIKYCWEKKHKCIQHTPLLPASHLALDVHKLFS